ncbi:MAG: group II intron reverse transcriptase/maturase [Leptospirillum sp.]
MSSRTCAPRAPSPLQWEIIHWEEWEKRVRKLQFRIAKAFREGKKSKVNSLQRILTRSLAAKALAVRRVTTNQGKNTPGVDRVIWKTPEEKSGAVLSLRRRGYNPLPLRRVFIPKKNGKLRGLGIPTMKDRAMQALYLLALIPVSEEAADPNSYGFRPFRSTADAIGQCFILLAKRFSPQWILEGDIKGCFDNIDHNWLMTNVPTDKKILQKWLKAGYMHRQLFSPTVAGTPQGGIISPTVANWALDGLENELKKHFHSRYLVHMARYADDFVITGRSKEHLEQDVRPVVEAFLRARGLELSKEKTRITHIQEGFDFLGQNVRKYGEKLLIKPARKNVKAFLDKVRDILKKSKALTQQAVIGLLNPIIRGWANYHRHIVAKRLFGWVDAQIWKGLWAWSRHRHPNKGKEWTKNRYFQQKGYRNWVFTQPDGKGAQLVKASDTSIRRHVKVRKDAHPFNPIWTEYFEKRKSRSRLEKEMFLRLSLLFG